MIKKLFTLLFLLITFATFAQKTDTETKKIKIPVPKSDFFNAIKTYNIIIQGHKNWSYTEGYDRNKTYQHLIALPEYKNDKKIDSINPDIKILTGFIPTASRSINSNGQTVITGNFNYLILGKDNSIIFEKTINTSATLNVTSKSNEVNMANTLCRLAYNALDILLITANEKEFTFNYGLFEKTEGFPELEAFNAKNTELLAKLETLNFDDAYLEESQTFYKSYIGKQFGKIKEKELNKVIYLNLSLIEIFKVNFIKANEYLAVAKEGAGMLSMWPGNARSIIADLEFINQTTFSHKVENLNATSVYYINTVGTATYKEKTSFTGFFEIPRFKPSGSDGNIVSLDSGYTPNFLIYEKGRLTNDYPNSNKFHIKTDSGKELYIMKLKSDYVMVEKLSDNTYKRYETKSDDIYTSPDNEKLELKKS
ncbi:hypothetical protein [Flavobacterium laiguense]|uniref:Uncharacterized protein n=1 Tax=Flavobacterium laiguense TaxID=2169409 RepID=A0A2U1K3E3_9FLAO|nr:hypothetical protein [Flavobacterium laiguense]PWA11493.1 hypothetical protein DB891_01400 [Flavobacterium laiguense]